MKIIIIIGIVALCGCSAPVDHDHTVTIWGRAISGESCPKREVTADFGEGYAAGISQTLQREYWATHH